MTRSFDEKNTPLKPHIHIHSACRRSLRPRLRRYCRSPDPLLRQLVQLTGRRRWMQKPVRRPLVSIRNLTDDYLLPQR